MSTDYIERAIDALTAKIMQNHGHISPQFKANWLHTIYTEQARTGYIFSSLELREDGVIEATWKNPHRGEV